LGCQEQELFINMHYQEIQPPEHLQDYIRSFWVFECDSTAGQYGSFRLAADGNPGLIFQHLEMGTFQKEGKMLPPLFLYGQATSSYEVQMSGRFNTIGIYFYPNALKAVFGIDATVLTNSCISPSQIAARQERDITEQLLNTATTSQQIDLICEYLWDKIRQNSLLADKLIRYAVSQLISSDGHVSLDSILKNLPLSPRNFERRFLRQVGITPKLFQRICQFQGSVSDLENGSYGKLSDIAFENGYADQSHFIRSFKEFAGLSPGQYQKQASGLFQNLSGIVR
jgi:AraC-like DNA-binding protein